MSKPLATLSSGLLARKGQARPAMRRQGAASPAALSHAGDDLGWNDMGDAAAALPPVLEERRTLAEELAPAAVAEQQEPEAAPAPAAAESTAVAAALPANIVPAARATGRKAAFTLRLDAERHLSLRLAAATRGRSAQQLMTEALDAMLAQMPDVAALRDQLPAIAPRHPHDHSGN